MGKQKFLLCSLVVVVCILILPMAVGNSHTEEDSVWVNKQIGGFTDGTDYYNSATGTLDLCRMIPDVLLPVDSGEFNVIWSIGVRKEDTAETDSGTSAGTYYTSNERVLDGRWDRETSPGSQLSCTTMPGNVYTQGTCKFNIHSSHNELPIPEDYTFMYSDVCLTQDVVGECYVDWAISKPERSSGDHWRAGDAYVYECDNYDRCTYTGWGSAQHYMDDLHIAVPRYAYVRCPSGRKCQNGACIPADTVDSDFILVLPTGEFNPAAISYIGDPNELAGAAKDRHDYKESDLDWEWYKEETYGETSVKLTIYDNWRTSNYNMWTKRRHLPMNVFAPGRCFSGRVGSGLLEERDQCTPDKNSVLECYISDDTATYGDFLFQEVACPTGTVCEPNTRDGARCEIPPPLPEVRPLLEDGDLSIDDCNAWGGTWVEGGEDPAACCGDDPDEIWNLNMGACYEAEDYPTDAPGEANILTTWSTSIDTVGEETRGIYQGPEEYPDPLYTHVQSSNLYAQADDVAQHIDKLMVLEMTYRNDPGADLSFEIKEVHYSSDEGEDLDTLDLVYFYRDSERVTFIPLDHTENWKKIRVEFTYLSTGPEYTKGIRFGLQPSGGESFVRDVQIYPENSESIMFQGEDAYWCDAAPGGATVAAPGTEYSRRTAAHIKGDDVFVPPNRKSACDVVMNPSDTGMNAYCDLDGKWKPTSADTTSISPGFTEAPPPRECYKAGRPIRCPPLPPPPAPLYETISNEGGGTEGCCQENDCFDGFSCVANGGSVETSSRNTMVCLEGEWQASIEKRDQYNHIEPTKDCGESQCFWNGGDLGPPEEVSGDPPIDKCVNSGYVEGDFQCVFGAWRSRTSMLATQMLHMTDAGTRPDRYTLFCDTPEHAALNFEYSGLFAGIIQSAIYGSGDPELDIPPDCGLESGKPCVNNVCVLKFTDEGREKVAVGMSLNKPINADFRDPGEPILHFIPEAADYEALYNSFCDGVIAQESPDWKYYGCNGPDIETSRTNVWYNPDTKSLIYSPRTSTDPGGVTVGRESVGTRIMDALLNPFDTMLSAARDLFRITADESVEADRNEVAKSFKFDRLYIQRDGEKSIFGMLQKDDDERSKNLMTVEYKNIPVDICTNLERIGCNGGSGCSCEPSLLQKPRILTSNPVLWSFIIKVPGSVTDYADKWDDLTSKTRLDSSVSISGLPPAAPSISYRTPARTGVPVRFEITNVPYEDDIIGYYWIFSRADGEIIGTGSRTRTEASSVTYTFPAEGTYNVELNVINKNFVVEQARTSVTVAPSSGGTATADGGLSSEVMTEEEARCIESGTCPGSGGGPGLAASLPDPGIGGR